MREGGEGGAHTHGAHTHTQTQTDTHMRFQRDLRSSAGVDCASEHGAGNMMSFRPRTRDAPAASSFLSVQPVGDAWLR
jgi:hypothetical protein